MARGMARRRSSAAEDDYSPDSTDEAAEKPARGSRRARTDEDTPPARGSRSRGRAAEAEPEDEKPARRASRRPAAEEDKPKRPKGTGGWGNFEKKKSEQSDFPDEFAPGEEATLIKFLDEAPFANYYQHWIERKGKKSFTCLEEDCPLCDELGDKPQLKVLFNIVDLADPEHPNVVIWKVGSQVAESLKNFGKDPKTGPLNRADLYWAVSRTKVSNKWVTNTVPVKERDLDEDWDLDPFTDEELDEFDKDAFDEDAIEFHSKKALQAIVDDD